MKSGAPPSTVIAGLTRNPLKTIAYKKESPAPVIPISTAQSNLLVFLTSSKRPFDADTRI